MRMSISPRQQQKLKLQQLCTVCQMPLTDDEAAHNRVDVALFGAKNVDYFLCCKCNQPVDFDKVDTNYRRRWNKYFKKLLIEHLERKAEHCMKKIELNAQFEATDCTKEDDAIKKANADFFLLVANFLRGR